MFFRVSIPALAVVNLETSATVSPDYTALVKPKKVGPIATCEFVWPQL